MKSSIIFSKKLFYSLLVLLIVCIATMRYFDAPLKNEVTPNGIVSFELAKELPVSKAILNSWNEQAKSTAGLSLGFDFLFLLVYASFIALLIFRVNDRVWKGRSFYKVGRFMIYAIFIGAIFDIIENIALIKLLVGDFKQTWSTVAYYFAILKFAVLLLCVFYLLISWTGLLLKKNN